MDEPQTIVSNLWHDLTHQCPPHCEKKLVELISKGLIDGIIEYSMKTADPNEGAELLARSAALIIETDAFEVGRGEEYWKLFDAMNEERLKNELLDEVRCSFLAYLGFTCKIIHGMDC